MSGTKFISTCSLLTHNSISRAQATVNYGTDRSILSYHLQYKIETTHDSEQYDTPSQPLRAGNWLTKVTLHKFQNLPEVTCVYGIDGKCSGTITPQCLSILQDAYNSARHRGAHTLMNLPVQDLATKIQGLVVIGRLYGAETFALPAGLPRYLQPALPSTTS